MSYPAFFPIIDVVGWPFLITASLILIAKYKTLLAKNVGAFFLSVVVLCVVGASLFPQREHIRAHFAVKSLCSDFGFRVYETPKPFNAIYLERGMATHEFRKAGLKYVEFLNTAKRGFTYQEANVESQPERPKFVPTYIRTNGDFSNDLPINELSAMYEVDYQSEYLKGYAFRVHSKRIQLIDMTTRKVMVEYSGHSNEFGYDCSDSVKGASVARSVDLVEFISHVKTLAIVSKEQ